MTGVQTCALPISNSHTPTDVILDQLIDNSFSTDPEVQKQAFFELQKYENESLFVMPLYYQPVFVVKSDRIVSGFEKFGNPQFNYNWGIQNWGLQAK